MSCCCVQRTPFYFSTDHGEVQQTDSACIPLAAHTSTFASRSSGFRFLSRIKKTTGAALLVPRVSLSSLLTNLVWLISLTQSDQS